MEKRIIFDQTFSNGYGCTMIAKYRNFQTWYEIEHWTPHGYALKNEYHDADKAFDALDAFITKHEKE